MKRFISYTQEYTSINLILDRHETDDSHSYFNQKSSRVFVLSKKENYSICFNKISLWKIGSKLIHCLYFKINIICVVRCSCIIFEASVSEKQKKKS